MKYILITLSFLFIPGLVSAAETSFENDVWPVLRDRCIGCHGAPYMKRGKLRKAGGGLRLDAPDRIKKGAKDNPDVVIPGSPEKSSFIKRLKLPEEHDDVMPPKGDLLTAEQISAFELWILEGAEYGDWKGLPEEYNYKELKKTWK